MNHKKKNLLFITTSSLAANPRLVKEFESLKATYNCHVICFKHNNWSRKLSMLLKEKNSDVYFIEIDRKKLFFQTVLCKVIHKTSIFLNKFFKQNYLICSFASDEKALQLSLNTSALDNSINFYRVIAHNLGAFYAASKYAAKNNIDLQLDIEDYYPGETFYHNIAREKQNRMYIMLKSFIKADYITYASLGIEQECEKKYKFKKSAIRAIIINSFDSDLFIKPSRIDTNKIKCVWFSQNISPNRGLELVFAAAECYPEIEFHVIGNSKKNFLDSFNLTSNVIIHNIMEQSELYVFLSNMDIGLALEPGKDMNNNIALSNKMIVYAQCGLYVLATNTYGQAQFLNSLNYEAGKVFLTDLKEALLKFDSSLLSETLKIKRWENAKSFCWESEVNKLKELFK